MHLTDLVSDTTTLADAHTDAPATVAIDITGLAVDSRRVVAGDLFFALEGSHADGRDYADAAIKSGAGAIVTDMRPLEGVLADVDRVVEAEDALHLVVRHRLLDLEDVRVHVADVVEVGEDERPRDVEAARDDVLRVLEAEAVALLELQVLPQELLVVGHLDDERHT